MGFERRSDLPTCNHSWDEKLEKFGSQAKALVSTSHVTTLFNTILEKELNEIPLHFPEDFNIHDFCRNSTVVFSELDHSYKTLIQYVFQHVMGMEDEFQSVRIHSDEN